LFSLNEENEEANACSQATTKPGKAPKLIRFDPDSDGFEFEYDKAFTLHKHMNMLSFVRKSLLANKGKKFKQELP